MMPASTSPITGGCLRYANSRPITRPSAMTAARQKSTGTRSSRLWTSRAL